MPRFNSAGIILDDARGHVTALATTTLGSDAASIVLNSIPGTYQHLRLIGSVRSKHTNEDSLDITFNTGGTYDYSYIQLTGSDPILVRQTGQASLKYYAFYRNSASANKFGGVDLLIPNYTDTNQKKHVLLHGHGTSSNSPVPLLGGGEWSSTATITQITISFQHDDIASGTSVTLYGINGA